MSAQRAQRECSSSEGVQEFGGCFVNLCVFLAGLCGKNFAVLPEPRFFHLYFIVLKRIFHVLHFTKRHGLH